jgi:superfamily II DNA/RNA helicase
VTEFIRYTERRTITRPFSPSDDEHALYEAVSAFLQRADSYALPQRQRHLTSLILRKLLASSSLAIAGTLDTLRLRLEALRDGQAESAPELISGIVDSEDMEGDLLDEILAEEQQEPEAVMPSSGVDSQKLRDEIDVLQLLASWARRIGVDSKTKTLLQALGIGFEQMEKTGAARKALIFTESRRTQEYLKAFLESNGYQGQVVAFNGTNGGPEATAIYEAWVAKNSDTGRVSGSRAVDLRTALIEHFRDEATILLATEAAAEGINLQFCSLVINYDLPWNPQRIEQRIGRCHRYGQKHDVVVINFLNERNDVDRRVLELLGEKFNLFNEYLSAADREHKLFVGEALHRVANARANIGEYYRAAPLYDDALRLAPRDIDVQIDYSKAAMDAEDPEKAEHLAEDALNQHPDMDKPRRTRLLRISGEALRNLGQQEKGLEQYHCGQLDRLRARLRRHYPDHRHRPGPRRQIP